MESQVKISNGPDGMRMAVHCVECGVVVLVLPPDGSMNTGDPVFAAHDCDEAAAEGDAQQEAVGDYNAAVRRRRVAVREFAKSSTPRAAAEVAQAVEEVGRAQLRLVVEFGFAPGEGSPA